MENPTLSTQIYIESTPNPAAMKFVASRKLIDGSPLDFTSKQACSVSPLAAKIFSFPFVTGVFIASNFITISKSNTVDWLDIQSDLRSFLQDYLNSGSPILNQTVVSEKATILENKELESEKLTNETDIKIAQILDEYIRPAVEGDGGAITFKSFKNGVVTVILQGSCSGCPSSTFTLKAGIEGLLKRLVPEVNEVVAEQL